jgi:diguanylate cyclase (GGDEF)-like protein
VLDEEFSRASRSNRPFALDDDDGQLWHFNDAYGHPVGDQALRFIADRLRAALRASDIIGRYGGDEFLAILPETSREEAEQAGRRVAQMVSETPFDLPDSERMLPMEISVGIGCFPHDSGGKQELLALADAALYEAKRLGGGRAVPAYAQMRPMLAGSLGLALHSTPPCCQDLATKKHCEENVRYADLADHSNSRKRHETRRLLLQRRQIAVPD